MTSRPIKKTPADRFPEFPPRDDMQNSIYLDAPAHQAALSHHFCASDTTIILSEAPIRRTVSQRQGLRVPDLLVAFGVDHAGVIGRRGYSIEERGKPPDFVLEIASVTTGRVDYTQKRADYAAFRVPEYWRFDPSVGAYHDAPLVLQRRIIQQGDFCSEIEPGDVLPKASHGRRLRLRQEATAAFFYKLLL